MGTEKGQSNVLRCQRMVSWLMKYDSYGVVWVLSYELWSSNVCEGYCMSHKVWLMVHKLRNQWSSWIGTRWGYRGARKTNDSNDPKVWWRISWRKERRFIKLSMLFFQLLSKLKYTVNNIQHRPWNSTLWVTIACERDFYVFRSHMDSTNFEPSL